MSQVKRTWIPQIIEEPGLEQSLAVVPGQSGQVGEFAFVRSESFRDTR